MQEVSLRLKRDPPPFRLGTSLKFIFNRGVRLEGGDSSWETWLVTVPVKTDRGPASIRVWSRVISGFRVESGRSVDPYRVWSLCRPIEDGSFSLNRQWPAMSWIIILGDNWARRGWTMRTVA